MISGKVFNSAKAKGSVIGSHRVDVVSDGGTDIVDNAIAAAFDEIPEAQQIDKAIAKRLRLKGKPGTREDTQKFYAFLARQGFGFDLIREKMSAVAEDRWAVEAEPPA